MREATMDTQATTYRVMEVLRRGFGCDLEELVQECPGLTWNQVFLEIDRLSRAGSVVLSREGRGHYRVRAAHS